MSETPVHILLVEDEEAHSELVARAFRGRAPHVKLSVARTLAQARSQLQGGARPAAVIADWQLPDGDGLELLSDPLAQPRLPVVLMTSHGNERVAVEAMRAGALDYVVKTDASLADLPHTVERALRQQHLQETLDQIMAGLTETGQAFFDSLVLRLAAAARVKAAFVSEIRSPEDVAGRTLAFCVDGRLVENIGYTLPGSPCADVLRTNAPVVHGSGVAKRFRDAPTLEKLGAEVYGGIPLHSSAGELIGLLVAIHDAPIDPFVDLTGILRVFAARAASEIGRLRAERALRASEERYHALVEHAPEAILVLDVDRMQLSDANTNAERLSGHSRAELVGSFPFDMLPETQPDGQSSLKLGRALVLAALEGGSPVAELTVRAAGGEERPCEVRLAALPALGQTLVRISLIDIGERKRLEHDLIQAAVEWRETFDGLSLGILAVDTAGRVRRANAAALTAAQRANARDLLGVAVDSIGEGEPWRSLAELARTMAERGEAPASREVHDPRSGCSWLAQASALRDRRAADYAIVLSFQDVTATVELRQRLQQSETMAAIGSVVAGVAHEVRNPLFSISATLDAFEARFGEAQQYGRYLDLLRAEVRRLTTLMTELLEWGRPIPLELAVTPLDGVLATAVRACEPLASRRRVRIRQRVAEALPPARVDPVRMAQVFQNLIENAVHFSPAGGEISVELGLFADEPGGRRLQMSVRDSGPGIAPADMPRLFEPFFTRRPGGTGLGLSIVRRILQDHGAEIAAANHPQGGALVTVRMTPLPGA
jgi:PAS domain S-box-containing protein